MIVAESSYEVSEPTVDSHIVKLKAAGVDTLLTFATGKFAAQTIKKIAELGWKPLHIVPNASSSLGSVLRPAGLDNAQGLVSATFAKDPTDPQWNDDPGMKTFHAFVEQVHSRRQADGEHRAVRLQHRPDHGGSAADVRRRSHPART